jgi:hypothetical protein
MSATTDNPYQSPSIVPDDSSTLRSPTVDWKAVLRRWEILRLPYNMLVGLVGLLMLTMFPASFLPNAIVLTLCYGIGANLMYLLGPATELYLNWVVDAWENRLVPNWVAEFVRSGYLTAFLFVGGTLFSVGLTLFVGIGEAAWANHQAHQIG